MKVTNYSSSIIRISLLDSFSLTVAPKQIVEVPDNRLEVCLYHGLSQVKNAKGKANGV